MSNPESGPSNPLEDKARIAELEDILRDIAVGAQMTIPYAKGAYASYAKEVERVATAGLPAHVQAGLARMKTTEDRLRGEMQAATALLLPSLEMSNTSH